MTELHPGELNKFNLVILLFYISHKTYGEKNHDKNDRDRSKGIAWKSFHNFPPTPDVPKCSKSQEGERTEQWTDPFDNNSDTVITFPTKRNIANKNKQLLNS